MWSVTSVNSLRIWFVGWLQRQSPDVKPMITRVIIVAPSSLVKVRVTHTVDCILTEIIAYF